MAEHEHTDGKGLGSGIQEHVAVEAPDRRDRLLTAFVHGFSAPVMVVPFGHLLVPAMTWVIFSANQERWGKAPAPGKVAYVVHHARECLRFQLVASVITLFVLLGFESRPPDLIEGLLSLYSVVHVAAYLGFTVRATFRAWRGEVAPYPWTRASASEPQPLAA